MADDFFGRRSETFSERPPERPSGRSGTVSGRSPEPRIHIVSARTSNNPYAALNMFCVNVKTKEHAQFTGCISFAVFICLTISSLMLFGAWAIFYIIGGIVIYAFLAESLFRQPKGWSIFVYIIFEVLQIGFYIALIILSFEDILLLPQNSDEDPNSPSTSDSGGTVNTFGWILFIISLFLLLLLKLYFIRVFIRYYKFITYQERHSSELRAEYINGRGVHMGFPINPEFDNPIVNDPSYGYSIFPTTRLPELPTYHEAMSTSKHPIPPTAPSPTPGQSFSSHNNQDPPHNPEDPSNNPSSHGYQNSDVP